MTHMNALFRKEKETDSLSLSLREITLQVLYRFYIGTCRIYRSELVINSATDSSSKQDYIPPDHQSHL